MEVAFIPIGGLWFNQVAKVDVDIAESMTFDRALCTVLRHAIVIGLIICGSAVMPATDYKNADKIILAISASHHSSSPL